MPIPRHSMALASVQLPLAAGCEGVTELRVHGVGGTPPDAILGDLAPEQTSGDQIAGFYRSGDHRASPVDQAAGRDVDRHVECYSWGGLTSRSKVRVLWLALLPFLLGNLAGWMCSARTRRSGWRFGLHRLSHGLSGLALTVNAALIAVLISADLLAYQAVRTGLAGHQWWLAPLGWRYIAGHPARQVLVGVLVPVVFLLLLAALARRSWRYEAVRPPYRGKAPPQSRKITAAALEGGLADSEFWDGEGSVRLLTALHIAAAAGFLAIALGVTTKLLASPGSAHVIALWWIAVGAGGVTIACAACYLGLDAFGALGDALRRSPPFLLVLAAVALVSGGAFAWLQPGGAAGTTEQEVLAMGTPLIWWAATVALLVCLVWWLIRWDWRAGAVLAGVAAGWLPWIWFYFHDGRTEFYYYAVVFDPFLVIAITLCLGLIIGSATATPARRAVGAVIVGAYLLAVLGDFTYIYPVLAAKVLPYPSWYARMWFSGWI